MPEFRMIKGCRALFLKLWREVRIQPYIDVGKLNEEDSFVLLGVHLGFCSVLLSFQTLVP